MRISDGSSDVCSSDLERELEGELRVRGAGAAFRRHAEARQQVEARVIEDRQGVVRRAHRLGVDGELLVDAVVGVGGGQDGDRDLGGLDGKSLQPARLHGEVQRIEVEGRRARSEEHTSEIQSLMRISNAVFCLKKKTYI